MTEKNKGGRPLKYNTAEELQEAIDKYFAECEGTPYVSEEGVPLLNKYGEVVMKGSKPPTVTGLALHIGFNSRQALLNYQDKDEFNDTITRAKARVEAYAESRLFDKDGANGAKFSLANNFKAWKERSEVETTNINIDAELTPEERKKRIAELLEK
jgi:hypothetical protein